MKKKEFLEILLNKKIQKEKFSINIEDKENSLYLSTFAAIEKQVERLENRISNFINFSISTEDKDKKYYILLQILYNEENYSNLDGKENFLLKLTKPSIDNIPQEYNSHIKDSFLATNSKVIDRLTNKIENGLFNIEYPIDQRTLAYSIAELLYELSEQQKNYVILDTVDFSEKRRKLNFYLEYIQNGYNNFLKNQVEEVNQKFIKQSNVNPSERVIYKFYKKLKRLEYLNKIYEKNNIQEELINNINNLEKKYPNIFKNSNLKNNGFLKICEVEKNLNKIFTEKELKVIPKISYSNMDSVCKIIFKDHSAKKYYDYKSIRAVIIELYVLDGDRYKPLNKSPSFITKTAIDKIINNEKISEAYELYLQSKVGRGLYREFGIINFFEVMHKIDLVIDDIALELMKLKNSQDQEESLIVFQGFENEFTRLTKKCR